MAEIKYEIKETVATLSENNTMLRIITRLLFQESYICKCRKK